MTEDDARNWISERFGDAAQDRIAHFLDLLTRENEQQNLISPSTIATIWSRHVVDSAQLLPLAREGLWMDIGTGGGFPGVIVALLRHDPVLLIEPRRRRVAFLESCIAGLAITNASVIAAKAEKVTAVATTISARAVAPIEKLLQIAAHCATDATRWLLPRGRLSDDETAWLRRHWQGMFHVEQSITAPDSAILLLDTVSRK